MKWFTALFTMAVMISLPIFTMLNAAETVRIYPAPSGVPLSSTFTAQADGRDVPVYVTTVLSEKPEERQKSAKNNMLTSFASFDMRSGVRVTVRSSTAVTSAKILPTSSGIQPVISGRQIEFTISKPGQIALELNDDWQNTIQIFANPFETNIPRSDDPNVIYFGPGVHQVESVKVTNGQMVYIAGGAVVYGNFTPKKSAGGAVFALEGNNITLRGRGIIDGSQCPGHTRSLITAHGKNIAVEGITLCDSSGWSFPIRGCDHVAVDNIKLFGWRPNADGIDICGSRSVTVSNCYIRTWDDLIVIKSINPADGDARDITVGHCVLWNEVAHALSLGAEMRKPVSNIVFRDCDVIRDKGREWVLRVYHCDAADISGVVFENIRIEEARRLFSLWIGKAVWSKDKAYGRIDDVIFRNITVTAERPRIEFQGIDDEHMVRHVQFSNVIINGKALTPDLVRQNDYVSDVTYDGVDGETLRPKKEAKLVTTLGFEPEDTPKWTLGFGAKPSDEAPMFGKASLLADTSGTAGEWFEFFYSDPQALPLTPGETYTVHFKYKALDKKNPKARLYFLARSAAGKAPDQGWTELDIEPGTSGRKTVTFTLEDGKDYRLIFGLHFQGKVQLDDVRIFTGQIKDKALQ
ncbi:MAG: endo-polygalacturonase [Spirochaetes bacterium]|nr:endo-polygalacturonase [Spirochaetota bacterium]